MPRPCITLLTDFGLRDTYVAQMKGVIARINPEALVVDLTHEIEPQQIALGSLALANTVDAFPAGTIHLAVVDPGVGSDRRLVAAELGDQRFVCPDNGLLTLVQRRLPWRRAVTLDRPRWWRDSVSPTFHGRDVLAPVAAAWSLGHDLTEFGSPIEPPLVQLPLAEVTRGMNQVIGSVIAVDRFGNLITNITQNALPDGAANLMIQFGERSLSGIARCYADRPPGSALALFGSAGRLELAVTNGNAAEQLGAGIGQPVVVSWTEGDTSHD